MLFHIYQFKTILWAFQISTRATAPPAAPPKKTPSPIATNSSTLLRPSLPNTRLNYARHTRCWDHALMVRDVGLRMVVMSWWDWRGRDVGIGSVMGFGRMGCVPMGLGVSLDMRMGGGRLRRYWWGCRLRLDLRGRANLDCWACWWNDIYYLCLYLCSYQDGVGIMGEWGGRGESVDDVLKYFFGRRGDLYGVVGYACVTVIFQNGPIICLS